MLKVRTSSYSLASAAENRINAHSRIQPFLQTAEGAGSDAAGVAICKPVLRREW